MRDHTPPDTMSFRRFQVAEHSMAPTFLPGDEFVANTGSDPRVGDVVAALHPRRTDFWLVKRLAALPGTMVETDQGAIHLTDGEAWVLSDNPVPGVQDSRSFGPVDVRSVFPVVERIGPDTFRDAVDLLTSEDEDLAAIVTRHGIPTFWARPRGFRTLTILILEQQVSLESAAAVFRRLEEEVGEISPETVASLTEERLNRLGLTRQKSRYVLELARDISDDIVNLEQISRLDTAAARARLVEINGIGPWTADAYLLSAEGRPDVFPLGDRALQVAVGECLGLDQIPSPDELELLSSPWRPIRSAAARLLWHDYLSRRGRAEPTH